MRSRSPYAGKDPEPGSTPGHTNFTAGSQSPEPGFCGATSLSTPHPRPGRCLPPSSTSPGFESKNPPSHALPVHGYPGQSPTTARPLIGGGRRPRSGREVGVFPAREVSGETRGDMGGGLFPSPSIVPGDRSSLCRQREHPTEILFLPRARLSGAIITH